jgi:ornithine carbamoyltransferase
LADLMTVRERLSALEGVKLCYIGDGNNMCNSLIVGGLTTGMTVRVSVPEGYDPSSSVLDFAEKYGNKFQIFRAPQEAAAGADVVATDVWASMGQEAEAIARRRVFTGYQVNEELMSLCAPDAFVLHCLPAHRGEEITAGVFEAHADSIFEEAENRLHAQKAVMALLMGG